MQRIMLKSKIRGAVVTDKQLQYAGSITLDENLLKATNMLPGEQVQVLDLNNGMRFVTYTIVAPAGSVAAKGKGKFMRMAAEKTKQ